MRPMATLGLILVIAGAAALILQLTGVFNERAGVDLGVVELEVQRERSLPWLPWAAGGGILLGLFMLLTGRRS